MVMREKFDILKHNVVLGYILDFKLNEEHILNDLNVLSVLEAVFRDKLELL